jgi:peptidyl-prolyl cis-trans isomerase SurA
MPVRTEFGYHLIYVYDKRPAFGKCKAAQILIPFNKSQNLTPPEKAKDVEQVSKKINGIYEEIKGGLPFEEAFEKYGEDGTNGKMPLFGCNRFEADFVRGLYGLKAGEISRPIQSSHGFHIVKIEELYPVKTDEEAKGSIRTKISQDTRTFRAREIFIERSKKENKFKEAEDKKAKTTPIQDFYTALDSNILKGTYETSMTQNLTRPMFVFAEKTYTQQDFARYLEAHQFTNIKDVAMPILVNFAYKRFIEKEVMAYEDSQVEINDPEFGELMRDYKEGVLLYELSERRVWKKPDMDSVGLQNFYETVKQKHEYLYPVRVRAEYLKATDAATTKKTAVMLVKEVPAKNIMAKMNKKKICLVLDTVLYWEGQNKEFDKVVVWNSPQLTTGSVSLNGQNELVRITEILQPSPRPLSEVRGTVVAEYQIKLEEEWLKSLFDNKNIWVDYDKIISLCRKK